MPAKANAFMEIVGAQRNDAPATPVRRAQGKRSRADYKTLGIIIPRALELEAQAFLLHEKAASKDGRSRDLSELFADILADFLASTSSASAHGQKTA